MVNLQSWLQFVQDSLHWTTSLLVNRRIRQEYRVITNPPFEKYL